MNDDDLAFRSVAELSRRLQVGEVSATQVVDAFLDRIDSYDEHLHAFVSVYGDDAQAAADAADRGLRRGRGGGIGAVGDRH